MKPCALIIPCEGTFAETVSRGYRDALIAMGWEVIYHSSLCKLEVIEFIEQHGVRLILTQCRTGTRQLPIDAINANDVAVAVQALPFNSRQQPLGGRDSYVDPSDPEIIGLINKRVLHTPCDFRVIDSHFHRWTEMDLPVLHLPLAGNLLSALPSSLEAAHDIAMVANLADKPDVAQTWVVPLLSRLRHCSFRIYGDHGWQQIGVGAVRPAREAHGKIADIYGRATVCPNLHAAWEREVVLNEQAYMIQLCGGYQITDNPLAADVFGPFVVVAANPTEMIPQVEAAIEHPETRTEYLLSQVNQAAANHTYFNRLADIFRVLGMTDQADQAETVQGRILHKHVWEMEHRIASLTQEIGA